jgi:polyribonucleotide nucleotidyltransferase
MSSNAVTRLSVEIAGSEISFETGRIAKQAGGAVVVRQGDTMVLATATAGNIRDTDFLPLTVDVEERMYAAGKIPGSFFKREGRAGEKGTLTARMIDRPIRPLFPKSLRYERRLGGADDLRHPATDPGRRGADRQDRRQLRRQPA